MSKSDPFGARGRVPGASGSLDMFRLSVLQDQGLSELDKIPMTVKVLLENLLRSAGHRLREPRTMSRSSIGAGSHSTSGVRLRPFEGPPPGLHRRARGGGPRGDALCHGTSGVETPRRSTRSPGRSRDRPLRAGRCLTAPRRPSSATFNCEYERNHERYTLLRWAQQAFAGFRVVPPGMGIVHQVNLEYIAKVIQTDLR